MTTSSPAAEAAAAKRVRVTDEVLIVELRDGRIVSVPLRWYPRLAEGKPSERRQWQLIGPGIGIHWPALDEDISVEGLLLGLPSGESAASLQRWRAARRHPATKKSGPRRSRRRAAGL
jgi:ribosomal protein L35